MARSYEFNYYHFKVRQEKPLPYFCNDYDVKATSLANARKQLKKLGLEEVELLSKWALTEEPQKVTRTSISKKNAWTKWGDDVTRPMK